MITFPSLLPVGTLRVPSSYSKSATETGVETDSEERGRKKRNGKKKKKSGRIKKMTGPAKNMGGERASSRVELER